MAGALSVVVNRHSSGDWCRIVVYLVWPQWGRVFVQKWSPWKHPFSALLLPCSPALLWGRLCGSVPLQALGAVRSRISGCQLLPQPEGSLTALEYSFTPYDGNTFLDKRKRAPEEAGPSVERDWGIDVGTHMAAPLAASSSHVLAPDSWPGNKEFYFDDQAQSGIWGGGGPTSCSRQRQQPSRIFHPSTHSASLTIILIVTAALFRY